VMPKPEETLRKVYEPFGLGFDVVRLVKEKVW